MTASTTGAGSAPIIVLKFGSSVLPSPDALPRCACEIYRWTRAGFRVVAVVSAYQRVTDRLLHRAARRRLDAQATATLVAAGEARSAADLAAYLDIAGVRSTSLTARQTGIAAEGPPLESVPTSIDTAALLAALGAHDAAIVPGYVATGRSGRESLLGRGGSDLSAVLLAGALGARCRLLKDVDGVYDLDPARAGASARRFTALRHRDALAVSNRLIQDRAIVAAEQTQLVIEIGALLSDRATRVGATRTDYDAFPRAPHDAPRRVALAGGGAVGSALARLIHAVHPEWTLTAVLVRRTRRRRHGIDARRCVTDPAALLATNPQVIIEALSEPGAARDLAALTLARGIPVVTANKALLRAHGRALDALAAAAGTSILGRAAVGGAAPVLERVQAIVREHAIDSVEGLLNGTTGFIGDRLADGHSFTQALRDARLAGLAEESAEEDLSGRDVVRKLELVARAAWPGSAPPIISCRPFDSGSRAYGAAPRRLVGKVSCDAEGCVRIHVAPAEVGADDAWASCSAEWGAVRIVHREGETVVRGRLAGGLPTALSLLADVHDLTRLETCDATNPIDEHAPCAAEVRA